MINKLDRLALCLLCVLGASHCGDDDDGGDAARGGEGSGRSGAEDSASPGAGGRSGADAGAAGDSGVDAGLGEAGEVVADGGTAVDGMDGVSSEPDLDIEDDGGSTGADSIDGGDAGGNADAGGSPEEEDPDAVQCVDDARAGGLTITDCERCLCQTDVCQNEMNAIKDDQKASALVQCSQQNSCSGQCCLCGDTCDLGNYGDGPCAAEANVAAGVDANSGLEAALTVMNQCAESGPDDSPCARAARLSACALSKCAELCPNLPACE